MNAQVRLDIARELLRLASPARRGLRKMVLNTKTGRRTYWVQVPKPKPRAIGRRKENLTAKQLGLSIKELSVPENFYLEGKTRIGTPVSVVCQGGEISFSVGKSYDAGAVKGGDAIGALKEMKRLMRDGMGSHPLGAVYRCTPYDIDEEKEERKKGFYQKNGFGEEIGDQLFAIKGENNLHPVDRSYLKEIKDDVEQVVTDFEQDRNESERIMYEIEEENYGLENNINSFHSERKQLRVEADREEDDDAREEMENEIDELDDLINDRRESLSRNEDRMLDVVVDEPLNFENIFLIHSLLNYYDL